MANVPPPQGLLGLDFGNILGEVTKYLPPQVGGAIKDTIGQILGDQPGTPGIGDPQPPGPPPIPVKPGTREFSAAVKAIDGALNALTVAHDAIGKALKLGFLIPDQYEVMLKEALPALDALSGALRTVRGWLD